MAYDDMTRCPQTEEEFEAYFYALIGRTWGQPATNWEAVMEAAYPWEGHALNIPPGVGPGIRQPPDAPFFGLTQQYSGGPKGRIFLPTTVPDELGYYTRCLQYLDDVHDTYASEHKTVTPRSTGLVWAWYWVAGHEYAPVTGADSTTPPPDSSELAARVTALEEVSAAMGEEMDDLVQRVTVIETTLANGLHAHGPINLPIVLESLTSLRCKGDIDVAVKPGQAIPPDMSADPPDAATILLLRRLLDRDEVGPV
jgi:hypothetical protein